MDYKKMIEESNGIIQMEAVRIINLLKKRGFKVSKPEESEMHLGMTIEGMINKMVSIKEAVNNGFDDEFLTSKKLSELLNLSLGGSFVVLYGLNNEKSLTKSFSELEVLQIEMLDVIFKKEVLKVCFFFTEDYGVP